MNSKTEGESTFESYLKRNKITFEHEPDLGGARRPDYLIESHTLVEVADFGISKLETKLLNDLSETHKAEWSKSGDKAIYGRTRIKINEKINQLSEYFDKYSCIILLYKPSKIISDSTEDEIILGAMYGPVEYLYPAKREHPIQRRFKTEYSIFNESKNSNISAVGILEIIKPHEPAYKSKLKKIHDDNRGLAWGKRMQLMQNTIQGDENYRLYHQEVPMLRLFNNRYAIKPVSLKLQDFDQEIFFNEKTGKFDSEGYKMKIN